MNQVEENKEQIKGDQKDKDIEENKTIAAIGYIWILCLIPLLLKKNSKFAQFHGKQGLVLFIVDIIGFVFFWIPFFGWLLGLLLIIVSIIGILKALSGGYWKIPVIGDFAKKINI